MKISQLFKAYLDAVGGEDKWKQLKSIAFNVDIESQGFKTQMECSVDRELNQKSRSIPRNAAVEVIDMSRFEREKSEKWKFDLFALAFRIVHGHIIEEEGMEVVENITINNIPCYLVKSNTLSCDFYFDMHSFLLVVIETHHKKDSDVSILENYREIEGIKIPTTIRSMDKPINFTMIDFKPNN